MSNLYNGAAVFTTGQKIDIKPISVDANKVMLAQKFNEMEKLLLELRILLKKRGVI